MKTPHDIFARQFGLDGDEVMEALTAAGYAVAPLEPTDKMIEDGGQHLPTSYTLTQCYTMMREAWKAMVARAQKEQT